jgi:hypothetical protein
MGERMAEVEGLELWHAKYHNIPHCYVKVRRNCWAKTLIGGGGGLGVMQHPCQPRPISSLPIVPAVGRYRPSGDKLKVFVSFMEMLWGRAPNLTPVC